MTKLLTVGDVIEIKEGMEIYAKIPEKFIYVNRPLSKKRAKTDICVGQILKNNISEYEKSKKKVNKEMKDQFEREFDFAPTEAIEAFVAEHAPKITQETFDTSRFEGEYVVIETSLSGGSTNSLNPNNDYPDGHHVICKKLKDGVFDPKGEEISFYQSGSFTAVIKNIQPLRQMKMTFVG